MTWKNLRLRNSNVPAAQVLIHLLQYNLWQMPDLWVLMMQTGCMLTPMMGVN